jgi:myosin-5
METLASLLHLANMTFEESSSEGGTSTVSTPGIAIEALSSLLGVESHAFTSAITVRNVRSGRGSLISMNLSPVQCKEGVAALVKFVYGELFTWLVKKINKSNATDKRSGTPQSFVGILDIFGFEIMQYNSLSQLCINFANEKLQQQFNHQIFIVEKELYKAEGEGAHPKRANSGEGVREFCGRGDSPPPTIPERSGRR